MRMRTLGGVMNKSIRNIENKYRISCCGTGLAMPGGPLRSLGLSFQITGPLSMKDIRKILVGSAHELISTARESSLDSYLYDPPFDIHKVQIYLFISSKDRGDLLHPDISIATLSLGKINYDTFDCNEPWPGIVESTAETYDEAVALLKQEADALPQDVLIQEPLACKKARQKPVPRHRSIGQSH